ncbi:MAG TPA: GNAT family acetyltransferase [Tepidisphaeraceae bacterium]|jgi:ribosomal protein S18 acetylase RimI-like enzyme|nr:GNAT family acetyltransferase [Tepidisphaeraceae bacterium]
MMHIRTFEPPDEPAVIELWRRCDLLRPWNDPQQDIQHKVKQNDGLFLVGLIENQIIASVMAGYDGHRGWLYLVAVDPAHQRRGHARQIITDAERLLRGMGCRKINLQVRDTNQQVIEFYQRVGYSIDPVLSMGKRFKNDDEAST